MVGGRLRSWPQLNYCTSAGSTVARPLDLPTIAR